MFGPFSDWFNSNVLLLLLLPSNIYYILVKEAKIRRKRAPGKASKDLLQVVYKIRFMFAVLNSSKISYATR